MTKKPFLTREDDHPSRPRCSYSPSLCSSTAGEAGQQHSPLSFPGPTPPLPAPAPQPPPHRGGQRPPRPDGTRAAVPGRPLSFPHRAVPCGDTAAGLEPAPPLPARAAPAPRRPGRAEASPQPRRASPVRPPPLPCPRRRWSKKKGLARSVTHSAPASSTSSGPSHIAAGPPPRRSAAERSGTEGLGGAGLGPAGAGRRRRASGRAAPAGHGAAPAATAPPSGPAPTRQRGGAVLAAVARERGRRLRSREVTSSSPAARRATRHPPLLPRY